LFLLPATGFFTIEKGCDAKRYHEHASTEEMVAEGKVHCRYPVSLAVQNYEIEAEYKIQGDDCQDNTVSQDLLFLGSGKQVYEVPAHHKEKGRSQQDGHQRKAEAKSLIGLTAQLACCIHPGDVGQQHGKDHL
jgi:hypothetical protein